ncbi:caspase family protein [Streptomyces sp. S.PB5]|uniref:caspase family protein n=1 Tax=Streptomyces sp. S.PB5 TaxID=3020844 RepID=UPI0025B16A2E|nr:caspase family protein [Streptomyces sp. S.PB5]MDN3025893.1 caspase family protein [Streptomyces sp. S.PB5]
MRRALLIGSQTRGLRGVHADVEVMREALTGFGFTVLSATGRDATTDAIVSHYRGLVEDTGPDDTAVVYYSGHGGRLRNPLAVQDRTLPTWLQYIVPTDCDDRSGRRARCVLAEELTQLQMQLTDRSRNVTVILDCCHAARMSRSGTALPKAEDQLAFPEDDLVRRWREARADRPRGGEANPYAVRVVACAPDQSAYEVDDMRLGRRHGVLTSALVRLLTEADVGALTWLDVLETVRTSIPVDALPQRPDVEGPADRLLFSLSERDGHGVLPVRVREGVAVLPRAAVLGVAVGDRYELFEPGTEIRLAEAVVERVRAGDAVLALKGGAQRAADLPPRVSAWPVDVALGRLPVAVLPVGHRGRDAIAADLWNVARVRPTESTDGALATVRLTDGEHPEAHVTDAVGQALSVGPLSAETAVHAVRTLAVGESVRRLPSGVDADALQPDVEVTCLRRLPGGEEEELTPGEHLFIGDLLILRLTNRAAENRYVTVFDVGVLGGVSTLTTADPSGVTLAPGEEYALGPQWLEEGMPLVWPEEVPRGRAREESFVLVVADRPVDRIGRLGTSGASRGLPATDGLERLVAELDTGRRDVPAPGRRNNGVRWRVERFDFLLHSVERPVEDEPVFEVDERPDASFRLVTPRGVDAPGRVAVRLKEVTVHSNRAFLRSRVRIDTMVLTASAADGADPYRTATLRFDRIKDGDRLPFDDVLVYEGPVDRFLDMAVWVARDDSPDVDLAELMTAETASEEVSTALSTLSALAVAEPTAALVAGSAAAVAVLVRTAARLIDQARGSSIGVYRTTLLPHQRFGAADGIGRHPAQGQIRAQDMSLVFEVVEVDRI